jgi:hypothetical protein
MHLTCFSVVGADTPTTKPPSRNGPQRIALRVSQDIQPTSPHSTTRKPFMNTICKELIVKYY